MSKRTTRVPLYTQIRDYVRDLIRTQEMGANERLPSENELAEQFQVSRITVKNALKELIDQGLIYRVQGKGSFVSPDQSGEPHIYQPLQGEKINRGHVAFIIPRLFGPYTDKLLDGISAELTSRGINLLFYKSDASQKREKELLRVAIQSEAQGIIIFPVDGVSYNEEILQLTMSHFPLVVVDRYYKGIDTNCVCSDNFQGAYDAVKHLIELGHAKIGFVSTRQQGTTSIEDRLAGYEKALADHGIPVDHRLRLTHFDAGEMNRIIEGEEVDPAIERDIRDLLQNYPDMTAVFGINVAVGTTVMETAMKMGKSIPSELSVVCFDKDISPLSPVKPTYVLQDAEAIGQEAVKLLLSIIENPQQPRQMVILPPKLIVRESSASPNVHPAAKSV